MMNYSRAKVEYSKGDKLVIMIDNGERCYRFEFIPYQKSIKIIAIDPNCEIKVIDVPRDNDLSEKWIDDNFRNIMGFIIDIADNTRCRIKEHPSDFEREMLPKLLKSSFPGVELLGWDKTQFNIDRFQFSINGKLYKFFYRYSEEKIVLSRPSKIPFLQVSDTWCDRNTFFGYPKETFEKEFANSIV